MRSVISYVLITITHKWIYILQHCMIMSIINRQSVNVGMTEKSYTKEESQRGEKHYPEKMVNVY